MREELEFKHLENTKNHALYVEIGGFNKWYRPLKQANPVRFTMVVMDEPDVDYPEERVDLYLDKDGPSFARYRSDGVPNFNRLYLAQSGNSSATLTAFLVEADATVSAAS